MNKVEIVKQYPKEGLDYCLAHIEGFWDAVVKEMSGKVADRLLEIIRSNGEIIVSGVSWMTDEDVRKNNVEFKHQIKWEPLVRCKECEFYYEDEKWCRRLGLCGAFDGDDFCSHAERREDGQAHDQ